MSHRDSDLWCPTNHGGHTVVVDSATRAHCARCDWRVDVSARESTGDARNLSRKIVDAQLSRRGVIADRLERWAAR